MRSRLQRFDRRTLYCIVTRQFVAHALAACQPHITPRDTDLIRGILLRNVALRRVSGKLSQLGIVDPKLWLWHYAQTIFACYTTEHDIWRTWQHTGRHHEVNAVLEAILDEHYPEKGPRSLGDARLEILASAFMLSLGQVDAYPFDLSLRDWLTEIVHDCVWAWRRGEIYATHAGALRREVCHEDDSLMWAMAAQSFESSPHLWDDSIDFQRRIAALSLEDQTILKLRLKGKRPEQIAEYVQLKPKTIYNKLTQLQRRLLDE